MIPTVIVFSKVADLSYPEQRNEIRKFKHVFLNLG